MPAAKKQQDLNYLLMLVGFVFLLVLSFFNIEQYLGKTEVLGATTDYSDDDSEVEYWQSFLTQHPDYIPGWIELGRWDKVKQIDPNYLP